MQLNSTIRFRRQRLALTFAFGVVASINPGHDVSFLYGNPGKGMPQPRAGSSAHIGLLGAEEAADLAPAGSRDFTERYGHMRPWQEWSEYEEVLTTRYRHSRRIVCFRSGEIWSCDRRQTSFKVLTAVNSTTPPTTPTSACPPAPALDLVDDNACLPPSAWIARRAHELAVQTAPLDGEVVGEVLSSFEAIEAAASRLDDQAAHERLHSARVALHTRLDTSVLASPMNRRQQRRQPRRNGTWATIEPITA